MMSPEEQKRIERLEKEFLEGEPQETEPRGIMGRKPHSDGKIRVGFHGGAVILDLGGEMGAVALRPDQAKQLARRLLTYASPVTRP